GPPNGGRPIASGSPIGYRGSVWVHATAVLPRCTTTTSHGARRQHSPGLPVESRWCATNGRRRGHVRGASPRDRRPQRAGGGPLSQPLNQPPEPNSPNQPPEPNSPNQPPEPHSPHPLPGPRTRRPPPPTPAPTP